MWRAERMETSEPETVSFKEAERAGWSEKAPVYDDFAGRIANRMMQTAPGVSCSTLRRIV